MWLVKYFRKKIALRELLPAAAPSAAPQVPAPHDSVPVPEESLARGKAGKGERERGPGQRRSIWWVLCRDELTVGRCDVVT